MSRSNTTEVLRAHCAAIAQEEAVLREGGGKAGHERQRKMGRLPVRERLRHLLDKDSPFFEIGLWAASRSTGMGENSGCRSRGWHRQRRRRSMHDRRERRNGEGRRVFSADDKEGHSRAADRVRVRAPTHLPRRFGGRIPADAG